MAVDVAPVQSGAEGGARDARVVSSLCGVCSSGCGVDVIVEDGLIQRIRPRREHPKGIVCTRGTRASEVVHAPDRLLYPQRRVGPRGSGEFERISWDEAYDMIVRGLEEIRAAHGPEAVAIYTGRGNFEFGLNEQFSPEGPPESSANAVLFPWGSPNSTGVGSLCAISYALIAPRATFGVPHRELREDVANADLVLVWGANPATASPPEDLVAIKEAQAKGGRVVVIDHRRSETARALRAEWIGVRPGTDGALALGMLRVVLHERLYDAGFVERWVHGLDELAAYVERFDPATVESITGIPAAKVVELARAMAAADGCSILMYTGLEYSNSGVQAIRAALLLQTLTGNLDVPGGKVIRMPGRARLHRGTTPRPEGAPAPIGQREFPLYCDVRQEAHGAALPRAIVHGDPYPVRGLIVSGASLITSWPDPARWREALAALDLLVVVNRFETADAAYADLILPATTMFEIESYQEFGDAVELRRRVLDPPGECRNDYLIFAELAARLGYGHLWPQTERGLVERALEGTGITYDELAAADGPVRLPSVPQTYRKWETGELREDGQPGFPTPSGRIEATSGWLASYGYDALPVYTEPIEGPLAAPELAARFPLVLNTGARIRSDFRSQHKNIRSLLDLQPAPLVHLHPEDAAPRGIADGDEVVVVSPRGEVRYTARVTEDIVRGAVEANMGGGGPHGPEAWRRANVNVLTDPENADPISGFPVYKALLCDVRRLAAAADAVDAAVAGD